MMALLPSYTAPPAVGWKASWLADEPRNRANPNNPLVGLDAIKSSQGPTYTMVNPGGSFTAPSFSALDPLMNNRAAWVFDSSLDRIATYNLTAFGPYASSVMVVRIPQITGGSTASYGMQDGVTPRWSVIQAGYSTGDLTWGFHGQGSGARFPLVRPIFDRPILLVTRLTASESSISVNGDTYTGATYSTNPSITSLGLGDANIGGGEQSLPMRVGFYGVYSGDVTTDPQWSNFLDWVQSHYGFDPRATYASMYPNQPPPIPWRAEYLADDFDQASGVWTDRTGRGYTLSTDGCAIVSNGLKVIGSAVDSWAQAPHHASMNVTNLDLRVKVTFASQAKATYEQTLMDKGQAGVTGNTGFWFYMTANTPNLGLTWGNGVGNPAVTSTATVPGLTAGGPMWVRVTLLANNGSGNYEIKFWTGGSDGTTWTQVGNTLTGSATSIASNSAALRVLDGGKARTPVAGTVIERAVMLNGIDGTAVFDADFAAATDGVTSFTESSSNAQTVTLTNTLPTKVANVLNGKPVVRFDGVDDYLTAVLGSATIPFSVVCLVKWRTYSGAGQAVVTGTVPASNWYVCNGNNVTSWMFNNSALQYVDTGNKLSTDWHLVRAYFNGASSYLYLDEVAIISAQSTGGSPLATITVGGGAVDIPYLAFYWGDVSTSALWSAWKNWANTYYGLSLP